MATNSGYDPNLYLDGATTTANGVWVTGTVTSGSTWHPYTTWTTTPGNATWTTFPNVEAETVVAEEEKDPLRRAVEDAVRNLSRG